MGAIFLAIFAAIALLHSGAIATQACPVPSEGNCTVVDYLNNGNTMLNLNVHIEQGQAQRLINEAPLFQRLINELNDRFYFFTDPCTDCSNVAPCYLDEEAPSRQTCIEGLGVSLLPSEQLPSCPWRYTCNYEEDRIPQYIWRAECESTAANGTLVYYPVPVLKPQTRNSTMSTSFSNYTWTWETINVPVACTCLG